MREILPGRLWLGNAADARNAEGVIQAGILAVVDLAAEEKIPDLPRGLIYCRFPIMDGQQTSQSVLPAAIETLVSLLKRGTPTLVFCGAGMSRSPALVAGALSIVEGGSPDDRLREIALGHPHDVSPQLWQAVRETCPAEMVPKAASMNDFNLNCPVPLDDHATVQLAHGGGGRLMRGLIEGLFLPAFGVRMSPPDRSPWAMPLSPLPSPLSPRPPTTAPCCRQPARVWPSPPTASWSAPCSSPAATSAGWPSTARSTTWRWPGRGRRT